LGASVGERQRAAELISGFVDEVDRRPSEASPGELTDNGLKM